MTRSVPRILVLPVLIWMLNGGVLGAQSPKPARDTPKAATTASAKPEPLAKEEKPRTEKVALQEAAQKDAQEKAQQFIQGPNIRIELTLTEQHGSASATSKTVMLTTGNEQWGKLRSTVMLPGAGAAPLNLDARPVVLKDGRIWVSLTVEYSPETKTRAPQEPTTMVGDGGAMGAGQTRLDQSLGVVLQNAQPLVVAQAADAISDRRVTVEVKATVLR